MNLIEQLRKKHEDRMLKKAKRNAENACKVIENSVSVIEKIEQEDLLKKQDEEYVQKLLNTKISEISQYIILLVCPVRDKDGYKLYDIEKYFLCNTPRIDMCENNSYEAVQISGNCFGKKSILETYSKSSVSKIVYCADNDDWCGSYKWDPKYFYGQDTETVAQLRDGAYMRNLKQKYKYLQKYNLAGNQEKTVNQFFD